MTEYRFIVTVETDCYENAARVLNERINHDEDYGFHYNVDWDWKPAS